MHERMTHDDPTYDLHALRKRLAALRFEELAIEVAEEATLRETERLAGLTMQRRRDARLAVVLAPDADLGLEQVAA